MLMLIRSVCPAWAVNAYVTSLHQSFRQRFLDKKRA